MVAQNQSAIAVSNERCSALAPVTGGANAGVMRSEIKQEWLLIKHSLKPGSPGLRYPVFFVVKI